METKTQYDYRHIVFLQGDEALPTLDMIESGALSGKDLLAYLLQFDTQSCPVIDCSRHTDYSPAGESDTIERYITDDFGDGRHFEICINSKMGYIGLCELRPIS